MNLRLFSTIYEQSYEFLFDAATGLSRITDYLFLPLRELIAPAFGLTPEEFFPNLAFLDKSTLGFVVGTGLLFYIGLTLWKYVQDALS